MRVSLNAAGGTLALALLGATVAGFHPYAEDGGVYLAGVKKLLDPALYPAWTEFVTEHLRFSLFAPMLAGTVRITRLSLGWLVLLTYVLGVWATLFAGWMLARRVTASDAGRWGAVALFACWLTLPIAGTSLMLMDPYLTARSVSTPLTLMALAYGLERRWWLCGVVLAGAATIHPLMALYGAALVLLVAMPIRRGFFVLSGLTITSATALLLFAPPESKAYVQVAVTRYYWFLQRWQWYEWLGLAGPMLLLYLLLRRDGPQSKILARACMALGAISVFIALLYARESMATHLVARLQPLRCFQLIYIVMTLLLGSWLGETILQRSPWRWALLVAAMGGVMLSVQRDIYGHSAHIEWPGATPRNAWEQAFLWARRNTPKDALFAMDAHYITQGKGEDAQCFRAIAERSALADYSKDGGEASITPDLTQAWLRGQIAQTDFATITDAERVRRLAPLGVTWVVLEADNQTAWACPYRNGTVKVCAVAGPQSPVGEHY